MGQFRFPTLILSGLSYFVLKHDPLPEALIQPRLEKRNSGPGPARSTPVRKRCHGFRTTKHVRAGDLDQGTGTRALRRPQPTQNSKPVKPFAVYLRETPAEPLRPRPRPYSGSWGLSWPSFFWLPCGGLTTHHAPAARTRKARPAGEGGYRYEPRFACCPSGRHGLSADRRLMWPAPVYYVDSRWPALCGIRMVLKTTLSNIHSRVPPTMTCSRIALFGLVLSTSLSLSPLIERPWAKADSPSQDDPAVAKPKVLSPIMAGASLQSINDDYARQLLQLERQRLERLGQLAARQSPKEAAETYERAVPPGHRQQPVPRGRAGRARSLEIHRAPCHRSSSFWPGPSTSSPPPTGGLRRIAGRLAHC